MSSLFQIPFLRQSCCLMKWLGCGDETLYYDMSSMFLGSLMSQVSSVDCTKKLCGDRFVGIATFVDQYDEQVEIQALVT